MLRRIADWVVRWIEDVPSSALGRSGAATGRLLGWLWQGVPASAEFLRRLLTAAAIPAAVLAIGLTAFSEPIVVDKIVVHQDVAKRAFPGEALSQRIVDHVGGFGRALEDLRAEKEIRRLGSGFDVPEFEIPGLGVSLRALVGVVRRVFGFREHRLSGELFLADRPAATAIGGPDQCPNGARAQHLRFRLRSDTRGEVYDGSVAVCPPEPGKEAVFDAATVDGHLLRAALAAFGSLNPCGAAAYHYRNWQGRLPDGAAIDPDLRISDRLVAECLTGANRDQASYAHYLQGLIRQTSRRPREALESLRAAEELHRRGLADRLGDFASRLAVRAGFDGFANYLPTILTHKGNVLLDQRPPLQIEPAAVVDPATGARRLETPDEARTRHRRASVDDAIRAYTRALAGSRSIALAYSGLGNALREKARLTGERRWELAAICVYRAGALQLRFDAPLRHHWGNALADEAARLEARPDGRRPADDWEKAKGDPEVAAHCGDKDPFREIGSAFDARREAEDKHRKAVDLDPGNVRFLVGWGEALLRWADAKMPAPAAPDAADGDGRRRRARDPATRELHPPALFLSATVAFERALEASERENWSATRGLARAYRRLDRGAEADRVYRDAARRYAALFDARRPADPWLAYHEGLAWQELGENAKALAGFDRALSADPRFAAAHLWLARLHDLGGGRPGRALRHYLQAAAYGDQEREEALARIRELERAGVRPD